MDYTIAPRCKICKSNLRIQIDEFLAQGKSYQKIMDWANQEEPNIKLSKKNVWNHNKNHRIQEEYKPSKRGRQKGLKNETPIKEKKTQNKTTKSKNTKQKSKEVIEAASELLDTIINKVRTRLDKDEINPTITEGIKAVEIKIKLDKKSPFEDTLLSFLEGISANGNIN